MLAFSAICPTWAQGVVSLSEVNSPYDEQHPVIAPSGVLFYTVGYHNGSADPGDIWSSARGNDWAYSSPSKVAELSTVGLDVVVGFLDDQNILVYHDGKGRGQGIHHYTWSGGSWNHKEQLDMGSFRNQSGHFSGRLAPSKDVIILSLASFGSYGNEDIYVSFLKEGGGWTSPQNLGPFINTYHQEMTPYLSADTQRLFFSTNGHGSTRGVDIYYSQRLDDSWENWSQPQPLSTANTTGAELAYLPLEDEADLAIYTSTQNSEGYGDLQIIRAELPLSVKLPEQAEVPVPAATDSVAELKAVEESEIQKAPFDPIIPEVPLKPEASEKEESIKAEVVQGTNENQAQAITETPVDSLVEMMDNQVVEEEEPKAILPLQVLDINSLEPIKYNLLIKDSQGGDVIIQAEASEERSLPETVPWAAEWVVTSPGYLPLRIKSPSPARLKEPVLLTPASKGVSMVLEDILFKRGTAELAEEYSMSLVNDLGVFLKDNPEIRILLEGHTDNLGNVQLNKELSLQRASTIRQLLVDQGIAFERIRIAGWGGSKPIADNQTEEGRTKNRRVEMVIQ